MGYPDDDPAIKPRMPMSAVFFEDKYDTEKAKAGVDEYDEIFKKYLAQRETNERDSNWSKSISDIYIKTTGGVDEDYPLLKQQGYFPVEKNRFKNNIIIIGMILIKILKEQFIIIFLMIFKIIYIKPQNNSIFIRFKYLNRAIITFIYF